jgi:nucleotide-binding universal stress UspA family protein
VTTIKRIVCAVDLTKASRAAFDRALGLARASKGRLYIVHAMPANERSWRATERLALFTDFQDRAERDGVSVRVVEQQGDPADLIVQHANAIKADLVVLGSNRKRGWERFSEGSVGDRVLRRAAWALLIVPWDVPARKWVGAKIMCAIDLTKASRPAFDTALSIARTSAGKLYVLQCVPATKSFSWRSTVRLHLLTQLRERAERAGVPVRVVEQHGDPASLIVLHANSKGADLVVLGSNRRRGWQRFKEGSVGEKVLRRAAWALLIVPWDIPSGKQIEGKTRPRP